jgi:hypothetical protein
MVAAAVSKTYLVLINARSAHEPSSGTGDSLLIVRLFPPRAMCVMRI